MKDFENSKNNPPKSIIKKTNILIIILILYFFILLIYAAYRIYFPIYSEHVGDKSIINFYYLNISFFLFFLIFFIFFLKVNNKIKVYFFLIFLPAICLVFSFELILEISSSIKNKTKESTKINIDIDKRSKLDVILDFKESGLNVYPSYLPSLIYTDNFFIKKKLFPLSGISNSKTVLLNEQGYFPIVQTDEYGFNNPPNLYNKNEVDIMLIGDSYTEGCCVQQNETIAAFLRNEGYKTISLGKFDTGSLIQYAILKEYAKKIKPKIIIWLFYSNDLNDITREIQSPLLNQYLNEENFSQNLYLKKNKIDNLLIPYFNKKIDENKNNILKEKTIHCADLVCDEITDKDLSKIKLSENSIIRFLKLYNIRSKFLSFSPVPSSLHTFQEILTKSKKMISEWDGELYFLYITPLQRIYNKEKNPALKKIFKIVNELDINLIKTYDTFDKKENPLSFFPVFDLNTGLDINGDRAVRSLHYNSKGYELISKIISKNINMKSTDNLDIND